MEKVLLVLGVLCAVCTLLRVAAFVWLHLLKPRADLSKFGAKRGAWAIVTGATDGIGFGFAHVLAARGFNIVLVSRSAEKLREAAAAIEQKTAGVQTKTVAIDCSEPKAPEVVADAVRELDVQAVVNNVGVTSELPTVLTELAPTVIDRILAVNCRFTVLLTRALLPQLTRHAHSLVVVLSSMFAHVPAPFNVPYSATKAFASSFAQSLSAEEARHGVQVVCIEPGYVATPMTGIRRPTWFAPTPLVFATQAVNKLDGGLVVRPYWPHALVGALLDLNWLPQTWLANHLYDAMVTARKKLQARQAREQGAKQN